MIVMTTSYTFCSCVSLETVYDRRLKNKFYFLPRPLPVSLACTITVFSDFKNCHRASVKGWRSQCTLFEMLNKKGLTAPSVDTSEFFSLPCSIFRALLQPCPFASCKVSPGQPLDLCWMPRAPPDTGSH